MSDEPPVPPVDDDMEAQEVGTSDELVATSDSINAPEPETSTEPEPEPEPEPEAPVEPEPEPVESAAPAGADDAAAESSAEPASASAPVVAPAVPVAAKMPPARPFTKENLAPADPGESLFAKKTPVHAYLAQHIQIAVRHALRALSAQRPEEPFVMASDVIRKWTPQSAPPRLSRPTGGATVGAREYLESVGILKTLHDGMCAMAKVRPGDPRQFLSDYLLDHAPVPEYVRNMEAFDDSDARLEGMDEKIKAGQAALEASRA